MDYQKIYNNLILSAKNRSLKSGYTETHHILPRSLGGLDTTDNLVELTAKEHYIAHHLLYHIYKNHENVGFDIKMAMAWFCMCTLDRHNQRYKISARTFSYVREIFANAQRESKRDKKEYTIVHKSGNTFKGNRLDIVIHTNNKLNPDNIGSILKKRVVNNWCLCGSEPKDFYWKVYKLNHISGIVISGFFDDIKDDIDVNEYEIDLIVRGIQPQIRGWTVLEVNGVTIAQKTQKNCLNNLPHEENPTICTWKNKITNNIDICTMKELTSKYQLRRSDVSAVFYGRLRSVKGWELIIQDGKEFVYSSNNEYSRKLKASTVVREWFHNEHGIIFDTTPNIELRFGIKKHYLYLLINGVQKTSHGWKYLGVKEE